MKCTFLNSSAVFASFCVSVLFSGCQKQTSVEADPHSGNVGVAIEADNQLLADLTGIEPADVSVATFRAVQDRIHFVDVHAELGIDFVLDNGASSKKLMPESTSGGCGWLDYDGDGRVDLICSQGGLADAIDWTNQPKDELFRNTLDRGFVRVAGNAKLTDHGYGHGVAAGDFNNDGFDDVYVSNVGNDVLQLNMGDGTFLDVTQKSGISNPVWAASAAWGDLDVDGDLDLYVCNYVDYDPMHPVPCPTAAGTPGTCHPEDVEAMANVCFFNQGDGTFHEEADDRGLVAEHGKSLGVVIADFNGDDLPDVFVANDVTANHIFVNRGQGRFEEKGLAFGCAMNVLGQYQASMGVAFGDYDRNGSPDLYVTHFTSDSNTLYKNLGDHGFTDATQLTGLHRPTLPYLAFGTVMADFDQDGWQDVFIANGHIDDWQENSGDMWKMTPQLFSFDGQMWQECGPSAGDYFRKTFLGRAVASADFDHDGDIDLAVVHQNDPTALLRNDSDDGHWLQLRFIGVENNRRGVGVKVHVVQGDVSQWGQLAGGTSYCASHEPMLGFGFGPSDLPCDITIRWPDGKQEERTGVPVDQFLTLREPQNRK